jgi:hypothetical protein
MSRPSHNGTELETRVFEYSCMKSEFFHQKAIGKKSPGDVAFRITFGHIYVNRWHTWRLATACIEFALLSH